MTTEEKILQEASAIFYQKGLAGARMQEIADQAGINKAMLHYYFKTKEQLFDRIFAQTFQVFAGKIAEVLNSNLRLEEKITEYVNHAIDALIKDPGIPVFVLNELTHHPERITEMFAGKDMINLQTFRKQVENQTHKKIDPETLFVDMVALCIYPFIAAPMFKLMLHKTDQQYNDMLQLRKAHIINDLLSKLR